VGYLGSGTSYVLKEERVISYVVILMVPMLYVRNHSLAPVLDSITLGKIDISVNQTNIIYNNRDYRIFRNNPYMNLLIFMIIPPKKFIYHV